MSFTPGPWHVAKGLIGREIRADSGPFVASVYEVTMTYGERNANARLLAAAPDMLAALRLVEENCNYDEGFLDAVKAAIAKAEAT